MYISGLSYASRILVCFCVEFLLLSFGFYFLHHVVIKSMPPSLQFCFALMCFYIILLSALLTCFFLSFSILFLSVIQYLQMKWPLLDVQPGGLQSRQTLKDARSPSPAHIVVSNPPLTTFNISQAFLPLRGKENPSSLCITLWELPIPFSQPKPVVEWMSVSNLK